MNPLRLQYPQSLAVYDDYAAAQKTVDFLSDNKFPVEHLMIVGTDLKRVERITGIGLGGSPVGVLSGLWLGLFVGLIFSFFVDEDVLAMILSTILLGALFGLVALLGYALTCGQRDFSSVTQVVATATRCWSSTRSPPTPETLLRPGCPARCRTRSRSRGTAGGGTRCSPSPRSGFRRPADRTRDGTTNFPSPPISSAGRRRPPRVGDTMTSPPHTSRSRSTGTSPGRTSPRRPLGRGGLALHRWHLGPDQGEVDARWSDRILRPGCAYVMGRNMFGPVRAAGTAGGPPTARASGAAGGARSRRTTPRCSCSPTTSTTRSRWWAGRRSTSSPPASPRRCGWPGRWGTAT